MRGVDSASGSPRSSTKTDRGQSSRASRRGAPRSTLRRNLTAADYEGVRGDDRLEAACRRALAVQALSYRSVESILKHGLDHEPLPEATALVPARTHEFVRGAGYYH